MLFFMDSAGFFRLVRCLILLSCFAACETESSISCTVPSVVEGEEASITWDFGNLLNTAPNYFINVRKVGDQKVEPMLSCDRMEEDTEIKCKPREGYASPGLGRHTVTLNIPLATARDNGDYKFRLTVHHKEQPETFEENCSLTVRESAGGNGTLENGTFLDTETTTRNGTRKNGTFLDTETTTCRTDECPDRDSHIVLLIFFAVLAFVGPVVTGVVVRHKCNASPSQRRTTRAGQTQAEEGEAMSVNSNNDGEESDGRRTG